MQKNGPFYLISGLLLILFFIIGVRYGQKVEKTNKNISAILSTTPKQTPKDVLTEYKMYKDDECNLQFLYPSNLDGKWIAGFVEFHWNKESVLEVSCTESNPYDKLISYNKLSSKEAKFQGNKVDFIKSEVSKPRGIIFQIRNPYNLKTIYIMVNEKLLPLLESSFEFLKI